MHTKSNTAVFLDGYRQKEQLIQVEAGGRRRPDHFALSVGATGQGTEDVLTGVTGGLAKPVGEGIKSVGNTVQSGLEGVGWGEEVGECLIMG